jgi:hypothetical protein
MTWKTGLSASMILLWACSSKGPVYQLSFHPQPGRVYTYAVSEETRTTATEKGEKIATHHNVYLNYHYTAGNTALHLSCDAFSLHLNSDGHRECNLDAGAALESTDPGERMFGAYDGAAIDAVVGQHGQVINLPGFDGIYQKMLALAGGGEPAPIAQSWQHIFGEAYFRRLLEKSWRIFPDGPMAVGSSWEGMDSLNADPRIPLPTVFTLVKARDGILYIEMNAEVHLAGTNLEGGTRSGQLTLNGRQHGMLRLDAATGAILDGHTVLKATGLLQTGTGAIPMFIDSAFTVNAIGA